MNDAFYISGCHHAYCSDCVAMYIGSKLEENITNIVCPVPGCSGSLEVDFCRSILPAEVFERWGNALCETSIDVSEKFYCPFADCSALLINDGTNTIKKSECPNCNRMLCAQCKVPWHEGIKCRKFKKLNADERGREDIMFMELAKNNKWKRCPKCRFYVAKSEGCKRMLCRCGCNFCYTCGGFLVGDRCKCFFYSKTVMTQQQEMLVVDNFRFFDNDVANYLACCCGFLLIMALFLSPFLVLLFVG